MMCVSEGCGQRAYVMAIDETDPERKVILPLCASLTCAPLAKSSGFSVRLLPNRKRATS